MKQQLQSMTPFSLCNYETMHTGPRWQEKDKKCFYLSIDLWTSSNISIFSQGLKKICSRVIVSSSCIKLSDELCFNL